MKPNVTGVSGVAEGIVTPTPGIGSDTCAEPKCRHRGLRGEGDKRAAPFVRGAHEAHAVGTREFCSGEHNQAKAAATQQEIGCGNRLFLAARANEKRSGIPERAGRGAGAVDPRRAIARGDCRLAGRAENRGRAALRFAGGELAEWKSAVGQGAVEFGNSRGHRLHRAPRRAEGDGIRKTLLNERAEGGERGRHTMKAGGNDIPNKSRK